MPELAEVDGIASNGTPASAKRLSMFGYIRETGFFGEQIPAGLQRRLVDEKFLSSEARGKWMLFKFSSHNWLGIHLGMTGRILR